jgi:uncharacterized iron-regulated membrane protein
MTLRLLRTGHRWIGLLIALPVAIQGLTGALLALTPILPSSHVAQTGPQQPIASQVRVVRDMTDPNARIVQYIAPEPSSPARIRMVFTGGSSSTIAVDPVTLAVFDEGIGPSAITSWIRSLHVSFLAPDYGGRSIGGWFGIGLVLLTVSGIPIWWPRSGRWREALTPAPRATGAQFHLRLHRATGGWIVLILMFLAVTGVMLAFPRSTRALLGLPAGGPQMTARAPRGEPFAAAEVDRVVALAREAVPDARLRAINFPAGPGEGWRVFMVRNGSEGAVGSVLAQIDNSGSKVLTVQDPRTQPPADRLYRWAHDLHEGLGLGPVWRIATIAAGASLPLFAITGPLIWWLRRRHRLATIRASLST